MANFRFPRTSDKKAWLKEGDEVEVGLEDGKVIIRPLITIEEFKSELNGCVEISKINPIEKKRK